MSTTVCHQHHFFCSSVHHLFFTMNTSLSLYPTPPPLIWSYCTPYCNIITLFPHRSCFCLPTTSNICHTSLNLSFSLSTSSFLTLSLSPSLQTPGGSPFTEITWPSALSVPRHPRCPHTVSLHFQRSLDQPSEHAQQCATAHTTGRYTTLYRSYSTQV